MKIVGIVFFIIGSIIYFVTKIIKANKYISRINNDGDFVELINQAISVFRIVAIVFISIGIILFLLL